MKLKRKLKFKVGDEVLTTTDHDGAGNELFPTGTKGVIIDVFEEKAYPYKVADEDGDYWFYSDDMLKADRDIHDIEAFLIAGEVLEKVNGEEATIREVIYYLKSFMDY